MPVSTRYCQSTSPWISCSQCNTHPSPSSRYYQYTLESAIMSIPDVCPTYMIAGTTDLFRPLLRNTPSAPPAHPKRFHHGYSHCLFLTEYDRLTEDSHPDSDSRLCQHTFEHSPSCLLETTQCTHIVCCMSLCVQFSFHRS